MKFLASAALFIVAVSKRRRYPVMQGQAHKIDRLALLVLTLRRLGLAANVYSMDENVSCTLHVTRLSQNGYGLIV